MDRTLACEAGNLGSTPNGDTNKEKSMPRSAECAARPPIEFLFCFWLIFSANSDTLYRVDLLHKEAEKEGKRVLDQWLTAEEFLARDRGAS